MRIYRSVYNEIEKTLGTMRPEEGGLLMTSDGGATVTRFIYDNKGSRSGGTYSPNTKFLNEQILKYNNRGDYFVGLIHSHPDGFTQLSRGHSGCGYTASDEEAIVKIFSGMKGTKKLYFPIVQSSWRGEFSIHVYAAERDLDGRINIKKEECDIVDDDCARTRNAINGILPAQKYRDNCAVLTGVKNSMRSAEQLARKGVSNFILIDGAKFTVDDLGRSAEFDEINTYVADACARKIKRVNPAANVKIIRQFLDEEVTDEQFSTWISGANRSRSLVCCCGANGETVDIALRRCAAAGIPFIWIYQDKNYTVRSDYYDFYITRKPQILTNSRALGYPSESDGILSETIADKILSFFGKPASKKARLALVKAGDKAVCKYASLYQKAEIESKTVVIVGCGGSRSYAENLARSGIRRFVLIDGDSYSESNLQTQMAYGDELGKNKAESIATRIRLINPDAEIKVFPEMLDEKVSDKDFEELVGDELIKNPDNVLIAGCTDNFRAQARCSRLALKYGTPYIQAGIYTGGRVMEIIFFHPKISAVCPRCMLKKRYEANLKSENTPAPAVSDGTSVFFTEELNAKKGYISLGLLLYGSETADERYSRFLDDNKWTMPKRRSADRNFMFYTLDAHLEKSTGIKAYSRFDDWGKRLGSKYQVGVSYFMKKKPRRHCPDCGGKGNLLRVKGTISDTRDGIYGERK